MQNGIPKVPFGFPSGLDYGQKSMIFDPSIIKKGVFCWISELLVRLLEILLCVYNGPTRTDILWCK